MTATHTPAYTGPIPLPQHGERFLPHEQENVRRRNEDFIRYRVEKFAEVGNEIARTGNIAVNKIGACRDDKDNPRNKIVVRYDIQKKYYRKYGYETYA